MLPKCHQADEKQKYGDTYDSKRFYDALTASSLRTAITQLCGVITDKTCRPTVILNMGGREMLVLFSIKTQLSTPNTTARLLQLETNTDLDRPPSEEEVMKAIKQRSPGKAPVQMPSLLKYTGMVVTRCYRG